ncbi:MAG: hypothetical protein H6841_01160 [Planctomycetes bacterium]|nr:hypothetical protein [Planctomycetota bacterium]
MGKTSVDDRDAALLERLRAVVREHSQARIARETGRSRTALTRYMKGAKLPLELGVALVEEFGINPAWLLKGQQPMHLADVPATASGLGNELLEMLRAMDNVAELRLGTLYGRPHARALREITDTLDRYGSLRDRLNSMSRPILSDLLEQAEQATAAGKMERARVLERVAGRLEKFCDDRDLSERLLTVRAYIYHADQLTDQAMALRSHAFHSKLTLDAEFGSLAQPALGLAQVLHTNQYCARARRVCRIAVSYARQDERHSPDCIRLLSQDVYVATDLGEFAGMPEIIEFCLQYSSGQARLYAETARLYYSLHRGIWQPSELLGSGTGAFAGAAMLMNTCFVTDDAELIQRALQHARSLMNPQLVLARFHVERAESVLDAMRGKPIPELTIEERVGGRQQGSLGFAAAVNRAHLLRLAKDRRAPAMMLHAQARLDEYPPDLTPLPVMIALHLRNVLHGIPGNPRNAAHRELRQKAERLCARRLEQGFGLLRLVQEP